MTVSDRIRWIATATYVGWLTLSAYIALIIIELRRAAAISESRFEDGVWGQRIEIVSFVALPQNAVILVPPAIAAAVGVRAGIAAMSQIDKSLDEASLRAFFEDFELRGYEPAERLSFAVAV